MLNSFDLFLSILKVSLGFFAKKKPTIQMLVNGEPIMSAVNTGSYVMHHSSGKIKDIKHPAGVITGEDHN